MSVSEDYGTNGDSRPADDGICGGMYSPADRFVCDSPSVVDRADYTTRGELDNPRGGWVAEFNPADGTYRASYPAMGGRVRVYRRVT